MNLTTVVRRPAVLSALTVFIVMLAVAALWFKPWGLVLNETVNETPPIPVGATSQSDGGLEPATPAPPALAGINRTGSFVPGEHDISGTARFIQTAQGLFLRLENLRTSNGPDVRVYLSTRADGQVGAGDLQVAPIKANIGSQNYLLPAGRGTSQYNSVVIWCERFSVGFGHAVLRV